ncbi:diguanylate cyclase [Lysobacteraceae bacterium NML75-0749]|nr:diguanylate cyclase [Xanthomonadaceae bacterium NML75-0749]PJK03111.1 diguanylate cyclase [Xanthomonadaceae bacterium NML91-0268]
MPHSRIYPRWLLVCLAVLSVSLMTVLGLTQQLDAWLYDRMLRQLSPAVSDDIRIVAIDEKSLAALGRWPWPRHVHAEFIDKVSDHQARGIAMDILFSEPDYHNIEGDEALAQSIARNGRVVLPVAAEPAAPGEPLVELLPIPSLAKAAAALGHVEIVTDDDGIARHAYLYSGLGAPHWPALALALLDKNIRHQYLPPRPAHERQSEAANSPFLWIRDREVLLPYVPAQRFRRIPYVDVINDEEVAATLHGKWVLVGVTSSGLVRDVVIPAQNGSNRISGVEYHAEVLNTLLHGGFVQPLSLPWQLAFGIILVLIPAGLRRLHEPRLNPWIYAAAALAATFLLSLLLLNARHIWFAPASAALVIAAGAFISLSRSLKKSQHMANSDGLTALANRHMFEVSIKREVASAKRTGKPISLLLIDLDHFKQYNDNYGHQAGDALLQAISEVVVEKARRPRDLASRYGGDELALLLPETDLPNALKIAESIAHNVRALDIRHAFSSIAPRATLSIGVCTLAPDAQDSTSTLLERADAALYQAKRAGRNQVKGYGLPPL